MDSSGRMAAAVYQGRRDIVFADLPVPEVQPGGLLLKVGAVGICGTDAHEYEAGPNLFPDGSFVPGHEFAGRVEAIGAGVESFEVGDLVASGAGVSCGECRWCLKGATNLCSSYETLGLQLAGGLAQYVAVPAGICIEVGSMGLTADAAALTQPMSIALHATRRGRVQPGDTVAVVGVGGIGAFMTFALAQLGVEVHVFDIDDRRLKLARTLGAANTTKVGDSPALQPADDAAFDLVYEVSGIRAGLDLAWSLASAGTRLVLVGLQSQPMSLDVRDLSLREVELIGTNAHAFGQDFRDAALLLAGRSEGWSDIAPEAIPLADLVDRGLLPIIEGRQTSIKTLIDPWTSTTRASQA